MYCKPSHVLPAIVHPTKCCVDHNFVNNVVPHIHPTHTTTVNHINYQHQHYFPHSQSVVNEVTNQQFFNPPYPVAGPFGPRPRPGAVAGAFDYPGYGPGMGPDAVAGEYFPGAQKPPNWR
ncbi:Spore coat protein CotD [Bacillus methanolicus PB1]|uniref:Spore coat protein CotD n=1 Tax=Bacillus methanolicus PB1 TaxID=997296 RepID=I3DWL0_BACMT|nr:spore coat protein [Bacillus methanolicus]EIJ78631.1 Spore coat protein CotD [Bacillus methanolicus PB1]